MILSEQELKEIQAAKDLLKKYGYFTDNLWCVDDVKSKYSCTDEEAQGVLGEALANSATMEQIWFAIDFHAEEEGLKKIENYFKINGFWKDDKVKFSDYIVKENEEDDDEDQDEDEDIFYYGLSEEEIQLAIMKKWKTDLDFVITSYEKITL